MPKRSALDWALLVTGGAALGAVLTMLFSRDDDDEARAAQQQAEAAMQQSELRQGLVAARAELSELAKLSSQLLAKQQHRMDELEASLAAAAAAQAEAPVTQADPTELLASLRAEVVPMVAAALDRRLEEQYSPAVEQQLAQTGEALHPPEGSAAALERYLPPAIAAALREERAKAELDAALEDASIASPAASNGPAAPASGGGAGASGGGGAASGVDAAGGVTASGAGFSVTHATTDTPLAARPPLLPLTPLSRDALAFYPASASASASASHSAPSAAAATAVTSTATATAAATTTTTAAAAAAAALPAVDVGQASAAAAGSCLNGGGPSRAQPSLSDVMRLMQARETLGPHAARLKPKPKPAP